MNALPWWLFLLVVAALVALIAFLMWANHEQRLNNRRLARRLHHGIPTHEDDGRIPLGELMGGGQL